MHGDRLSLLALTIAWKKAVVSSTVSRPDNSARRTSRSRVILYPMAPSQRYCAFPSVIAERHPALGRWGSTEPIEQIRRDALDARVHGASEIQSPAPAGRTRAEHPGAARRLVDRRVRDHRCTAAIGERRLRQHLVGAGDGSQKRDARHRRVGFVADDPGNAVAVGQPRAYVHPARAVLHDIWRVWRADRELSAGELHPYELLLGAADGRIAPQDGGRRALYRVRAVSVRAVLVANHHAVGDAAQRRRLEPDLPEHPIRAEEPAMDPGVACRLHTAVHRLRPVLAMSA